MRQVDEMLDRIDTRDFDPRNSQTPQNSSVLPGLSLVSDKVSGLLINFLTRVSHAGRVVSDVLEKVRGINPK